MKRDRLIGLTSLPLLLWRYVLAALFVGITLLFALAVEPYVTTSSPFLPFIATVMVTAGIAGFHPALFATAMSALVVDYYLIPPKWSFAITIPDLLSVALFVAEGVLICSFIEYLRLARRTAADAQRDLTGLYLHSSRLLKRNALGPMLQQTLSAAMDLVHSDKGVIQVYDRQTNALELIAHIGFPDGFSERFHWLPAGFSTCGAAAERRTRVVVEDIAQDGDFRHLASVFAEYGVVAVQSTPLFRQSGEVFGVLSTYRSQTGRPPTATLNLLDLYLRQAERILEAKWQEERLRSSNEELEAAMRLKSQELLEKESYLRDLVSQLVMVEERERDILAAELHDYLAQMLIVARMKLKFVGEQPGAARAHQSLREADDILRRLLAYSRTMMAELVPPELEKGGLPAALRWLTQQMPEHGLRVDLNVSTDLVPLARETAMLLYRSIRELLINVAKHAEVDHATVSLKVEQSNTLMVIVADRGKGFDVATLESKTAAKHFGVASIKERMLLLGAAVSIQSQPGKGTIVTLTLPLHAAQPLLTRAALPHPTDRIVAAYQDPAQQALPLA